MAQVFIDHIYRIVHSNIEKEGFGVNELSRELGLSRSQVLRKTKVITGKSVNQLIKEIRLEQAAKLVVEGNLTASEIAYRVGFSSPSYFNKCFHDFFGATPGEYKRNPVDKEVIMAAKPEQKRIRKPRVPNKVLVAILILVVISAGFYLMAGKHISIKKINRVEQPSIAVLPFLDLSANNDMDYLSDGITEEVTLELSRLDAIRVISRTSAMMFKGEKKLTSDIARELQVDFLLEGSVFYESGNLKVVVQLIEPLPVEKHIWAGSYNQDYDNIISLISQISNKIANEVHLKVAPEGLNKNTVKVNSEAYDLYLRGRHLWNQQSIVSLSNSIAYLNTSIALDPSYAPAHVALADAYISMNKLIPDFEEKHKYRDSSRAAVNKAIQIDNNLSSAYITYGEILGKFDWDWNAMKQMAEKGLELNPNNSYGHILLSDFYLISGDFQKSIEESLLAEQLDPINPVTGCRVAERFLAAGRYNESIKQFNKVLELFPDYGYAWDGIGYAYLHSGKREEAINAWQRLHILLGNDSLANYYETATFEESLQYWLTNAKGPSPQYCSNPTVVATVFMMLSEHNNALDYLQVAFEKHDEELPLMLFRRDFYPLHNEPRFNDLISELGISMNF